jgi:MEMO1 family protein
MMRRERAPIVDEFFYPAQPRELRAAVRELLDGCGAERGRAAALVLPHAAYPIAGALLAAGFAAAAARSIERVIVLAPIHRDTGNKIVLPESNVFLTPIGETEVDEEVLDAVEGWSTAIVRSDVPHLEEHAIEVCLPFVQVLFPKATLVPLLIGRAPGGLLKTLGRAISGAIGDWGSTLLVASSNLNGDSGGMREANTFLSALGATRSGRCMRASARGALILDGARSGRVTACGAYPVAALLELPPAAGRPRLLGRADSGREAPRRTYYGAVAIE